MNNLIDVLKSRPALVIDEILETEGVKTLVLRLEGEFKAEAGQFNMVYYWGVGEVPLSISKLPLIQDRYTFIDHTIRDVGAVTRAIYRNAKIFSTLGIRGPYGKGWPLREHEGFNLLLIAGGLGMVPLRPVINYVGKNRSKYGELILLYGVRKPEMILFRRELSELSTMPLTRVVLSVDQLSSEDVYYVGPVTDLIDKVGIDVSNTVSYICGPEAMIRTAIRKLIQKGLRKDRIFISLERRMRCGVGICGTCQLGHYFVCKDGPVFRFDEIEDYFWIEGI
ncbi:MAG: FAD/NAD(P)-binding protein [Desulfurococcaceae archaeon]